MAVVLAAGVVASTGVAPAMAAPGDPVAATLVQAIPGPDLDVYVDDTRVADDLEATSTVGISLEVGTEVRIRFVPGTNPNGITLNPVVDETVTPPDTPNVSIVAALDTVEQPVLLTYIDASEPECDGVSTMVLRHTGPYGPVDTYFDGELVSEGLEFGDEDLLALPVAEQVQVVITASGDPIELAITSDAIETVAGSRSFVYLTDELTVVPLVVGTENCDETPAPTPPSTGSGAGSGDVADDGLAALPTAVPAGATPAEAPLGPVGVALGFAVIAMLGIVAALRRQS